jgi:hypothetical protein
MLSIPPADAIPRADAFAKGTLSGRRWRGARRPPVGRVGLAAGSSRAEETDARASVPVVSRGAVPGTVTGKRSVCGYRLSVNVVSAVIPGRLGGVNVAFAVNVKCCAAARSLLPRRVNLTVIVTDPPLAKRIPAAAIMTGLSLLARCARLGTRFHEIEI